MKKVLNGFGIFFALILSAILIIGLLIVPFITAASSVMQGDTMHRIVKNVDFSDVVPPSGFGGSEMVEDIIESDAVGDIFELYFDTAFDIMEGDTDAIRLSQKALKEIAEDHEDELIEIISDYIDEDDFVSDEQMSAFVELTVEEYADEMFDMLPPVEDFAFGQSGRLSSEDVFMRDMMIHLHNGTLLIWAAVGVGLLSLLVYLCRAQQFRGFKWLGVVYLLSAVLSLVISLFLGSELFVSLMDPGSDVMIVKSLVAVISQEMLKGVLAIAICAVVFIILYVVTKKARKKETTIPEMGEVA